MTGVEGSTVSLDTVGTSVTTTQNSVIVIDEFFVWFVVYYETIKRGKDKTYF